MAYEPPEILSKRGTEYAMREDPTKLKDLIALNMSPGEKLFYEKCTLCHVPRDPKAYTQKQWKAILPSMFPQSGASEKERKLIEQFLLKNAKSGLGIGH